MSTLSPLVRILLVCVVCAAGAVPAEAQAPGPGGPAGQGEPVRLAEADFEAVRLKKIVTAIRITDRITLDGRLDEPAWKLASPVGDFFQRVPISGMPAGERTEVRVLYDDDNLYFGVILLRLAASADCRQGVEEGLRPQRHRHGPDRDRQPARRPGRVLLVRQSGGRPA